MSILTVAELRKHLSHPTGADADDALQRLLDDAERSIVGLAGAPGPVMRLADGGWGAIAMDRPIDTITTVTEAIDGTPVVLSAADYRFTAGGYVLRRLPEGTAWSGVVEVAYVPADDAAAREVAQVALVRLSANRDPGVSQRTIGDWSETYATDEGYQSQRAAILADLVRGPVMVVL